MCERVCACVCVCVRALASVRVCFYVYACFVGACVYVCVCLCVCMCVCTYKGPEGVKEKLVKLLKNKGLSVGLHLTGKGEETYVLIMYLHSHT